ncbi:MAG: hypothetical protein LBH03_03140 [Holophagales bacterium]|jgi:predicted negative regulator of RcsB-dependent stress response|nr:hypothetical protein [Holophagales bacterium]
MALKTNIKQKEIRIQKPAQSLSTFQSKITLGMNEHSNLMKRFIIVGVAILLGIAVVVFWNIWRHHKIEQHETAMSALILEVEGTLTNSVPPAEKEQRMRNALSRLEELARTAPGACKSVANGMVSTWKLELDGKGTSLPTPADPWSRLRLAQKNIVLGQSKEAGDAISVLHKIAKPNQAWSQLYWSMLLQIRQLDGDREQALKDYAEYRKIFREQSDLITMDKILDAI